MKTDMLGVGKKSGSIGNLTVVNMGDETIVRAKKGKEPKGAPTTYGRRRSQAAYALLMNAYRILTSLLKTTLLRDKPMQRANGLFLQCNSDEVEALAPKHELEQGLSLLMHYQVSKGNGDLPTIGMETIDMHHVTDIRLGALQLTAETTLCQLSTAIVAHNDAFAEGDALTWLACTQVAGTEDTLPHFRPRAHTLPIYLRNDFKGHQAVWSLMGGEKLLSVPGDDGNRLAVRAEDYTLVAFIHSRLMKDRRVNCSAQRLVGHNPTLADYASPEAIDRAVRSFGPVREQDQYRPNPHPLPSGSLLLEDMFQV